MENQSAFKRATSLSLTGVATLVFLAVVAQPAFAHFPIIAATASCSNGAAVINYTVTSWSPGTAGGSNPAINVNFNGITVDTEPLLISSTPPDQFSNVRSAPPA